MAARKGTAPSVEYRHDDVRGEHQIGVELEGAFVPLARVPDSHAVQLAENFKNTEHDDGSDKEGSE